MASLRCASSSSELFCCKSLHKTYGGSKSSSSQVGFELASTPVSGMRLQRRSDERRGRDWRSLSVASSVEAAEVETERETTDVELLEQRRQIIEEDVRSRGFALTEVATTGFQDWHPSKVVGVLDVAPGVRCITVETEVSREAVALDKAYVKPGQPVQVKINGKEMKCAVSSPPFSEKLNVAVLYKLRGDIPAGTTKLPQYSLSIKAPFDLHVEEATSPELYNVSEGEDLEVGAFEASGLDLRPISYLARFPTLVIFAQGSGIAIARAIAEAKDGDTGSMNLSFRNDVRLFYSAPKPSDLAYKHKYGDWESKNVKVRTTVDDKSDEEWQGNVGSLINVWDEDDLEYDPATTAAIVCVGKNVRQAVLDLLAEAGIPPAQMTVWECS